MWLRELHMCFEEATYHPWSDLLQHRPEGSLEFSSDSPEAHKRGQEDWEHDQSESGVSLAESASPTTFLAGLKHTNLADKDCSSKAGCFDELGEVRSMSSAQFTCQPQKEGYLEDRNDFYRKQLSYWRWEPLWLEQQNWNCQKLWIGRDWHYKSRKSFITSRGMSNPCLQSVRSLLSEHPISPHIPHPFLQWRLPSEQCKEPELSNSFAQPQKKPTTLEPTCHCENLQQSLDSQISDCFHRVRKTRLTIEQRMLLMNQEQAGEEKLRSRTSSDIQPNSHRSFWTGWISELHF